MHLYQLLPIAIFHFFVFLFFKSNNAQINEQPHNKTKISNKRNEVKYSWSNLGKGERWERALGSKESRTQFNFVFTFFFSLLICGWAKVTEAECVFVYSHRPNWLLANVDSVCSDTQNTHDFQIYFIHIMSNLNQWLVLPSTLPLLLL